MIFTSRRRPGFRASPLLTLMVALISFAWVGTALAQDQATIDKLVQLNKKAMDDYDTADFDAAKKSLLDAEKTGKRAGLESHPIMARTYIHLGALYLTGYKDNKKAQHYFGKALDIQGDIKLDKNLTSSALKELFASVKAAKGETETEEPPPPPTKKGRLRPAPVAVEPEPEPDPEAAAPRRRPTKRDRGGEPDLPTTITALDCPYPDDTPPGKKVTLRCVAAANLKVSKVALYYKGHEMTDYEQAIMTKSPKGWWQVPVPKKRVDGKSLQFYFEGLDDSDKPVVSNGRAESPNVMLIVERGNKAAAEGEGGEGEEEENPLEQQRRQTPKLLLGHYDKSQIGVDERYGNRRFWIGIGAGTGIVYAINGVPESRVKGLMNQTSDVTVTGVGWAGLGQLVPEIGVHINPDWAISIEGRHQWIPQADKAKTYTASGAHAVLLKVIRYTKQQKVRLFFAAAGGGGEGARMNIPTDYPVNPALKDTILVGSVLLGGSAGLNVEISKRLSWIAEVNALFGFPKKGAVVDFNTALQVNFGDTSGAAEKAAASKVDSVSGSIDDEEPK